MKTISILFTLLFVNLINAQQVIYSFNNIPSNYVNFNNKIFFAGSLGDTGNELWSSEGTTENTHLIKETYVGNNSGINTGLRTSSCQLNGKLYFFGRDENSDGEIWETDGTTENTVKITNFINGRSRLITPIGEYIFFTLKSEQYKLQIWKLNTITKTTELIKEVSDMWNNTSFEGEINNTFILTFQNYGTNSTRVWRSDGTENGTFPLTDNIDGNGSGYLLGFVGSSHLSQYVKFNNKLYFVTRKHLYETDGTVANTKITAPVWDGALRIVDKSEVIVINNKIYLLFQMTGTPFGYKRALSIWESDGTEEGTLQIYFKDDAPNTFFTSNMLENNGDMLFCSFNNSGGTSLFNLNLNNYSTTEIKELVDAQSAPTGGHPVSFRANLQRINENQIFMAAPTETSGYPNKGWIIDSSLNSVINHSILDNTQNRISYNNELYYTKDNDFLKFGNILAVNNIIKSNFLVFPNPSKDFIYIKSIGNDIIDEVEILDVNGRIIKVFQSNTRKIDIRNLTAGTYYLVVRSNGKINSTKIIKT